MNKTNILSVVIILMLTLVYAINPIGSSSVLLLINSYISDNLTFYYIVVGVLFLVLVFYLGLSKYGNIRLGDKSRRLSTVSWVTLIFTSTMAADILFFAFHEWKYYITSANDTYLYSQSEELLASTYSLFHWGPIAWSFYILPAVVYAYYKFVKNDKCNNLSSSLSLKTNTTKSSIIDSVGLIGLIAGVSSTYSFTTPLIAKIINDLFNTTVEENILSIIIILIIGMIYLSITMKGLHYMSRLSNINAIMVLLLLLVLLIDNPVYIINHSIQSIGNLAQNFIGMSTFISTGDFTKSWTSFYWSYWIAWSIATPFFIAEISEGRTIKELALGGLAAGVGSTFLVFCIITNSSLSVQLSYNVLSMTDDPYQLVLLIIDHLSNPGLVKILLISSMVLLYASTLDGILYVVSKYTKSTISTNKFLVIWFVIFTVFPIALLYNSEVLNVIKTLSIIVALPLSIIMIMIIYKFIRLLNKY